MVREFSKEDMLPFLIEELPIDAEYADNKSFLEITKIDFFQYIQFVDIAWSSARLYQITRSAVDEKWARIFEIKDEQLSPVDHEVLCSICIFKRDIEVGHGTFQFYVDALKERIERFRGDDFTNQKLRVYVGDSAWDTLYSEKILQAKDVDFVRMANSSPYSIMGQQWRILAYNDYDYPYVYMADTPKHTGDLPDKRLKDKYPKELLDKYHFTLTSVEPTMDYSVSLCDILLFQRNPNRHTHCFFTYELNDYFNFCDLKIIRGPNRLPFPDVVPIIGACYQERRALYKLYDSRYNIWTEMSHLPFWLEWENILGYWILFIRKHITLRYRYLKNYLQLFDRLDDNHFLKRFHYQILENRSVTPP